MDATAETAAMERTGDEPFTSDVMRAEDAEGESVSVLRVLTAASGHDDVAQGRVRGVSRHAEVLPSVGEDVIRWDVGSPAGDV